MGNVGGLGFGPDMVVVASVYAVHGFGLHMKGQDTDGGEDIYLITMSNT